MDIIYILYSTLTAPHGEQSSPVEKVALFTFRFKCLALIHNFLQVLQFLSFGILNFYHHYAESQAVT